MLQSQEDAGDCSMTKVIVTAIVLEMVASKMRTRTVTVCSRLPSSKQHQYIRIVNCEKMDVESVCHQSGIKWGQVGTL